MPQTIALKGPYVRKEGTASSAITPGDLVEFGGIHDLQDHSTVGGKCRKAFALENDLIGRGIADAYAAGETVQYGVFPPGSEAYARLAAGATCTKGQALESAGNGRLVPTSGNLYAEAIVAWALETVTVAGGRVKIEAA